MSSTTVLSISLITVVALAMLLLGAGRRRDQNLLSRETARADRGANPSLPVEHPLHGAAFERQATRPVQGLALEPVTDRPPVTVMPVDPETIGVTRRQFFNRSVVAMMSLGLSGFGAAVLAFLWPTLSSGFGSKVSVGKLDDILGAIGENKQPLYVAEGRFYLSPYPKEALPKAKATYAPAVLPALEAGIIALYQKCPHLGCRVPFCATSQWFECGCHGSQYNRVGEKKGGPAPRGMDQFPVEVKAGTVTVDTGVVVQGLAIGTNTTGQEAEGPHCVGAAGGH